MREVTSFCTSRTLRISEALQAVVSCKKTKVEVKNAIIVQLVSF